MHTINGYRNGVSYWRGNGLIMGSIPLDELNVPFIYYSREYL